MTLKVLIDWYVCAVEGRTMSSSWMLRWPAVSSLRSARCFWARAARFRASRSAPARCFSVTS